MRVDVAKNPAGNKKDYQAERRVWTRSFSSPDAISRTANATAAGIAALCLLVAGCTKKVAEVEPVVSVQLEAAAVQPIHEMVTAQAVVFPLNQAALVPKISAPVKKFYVKRGDPVKQGQLLAELENSDLIASEIENRGMYDQAEAAYKTSTGMSLPEDTQKAEQDRQIAKQMLDAQQKVYDSRKSLLEQGALPRKELDVAAVALTQARNQYELADKHLKAVQSFGKQEALKSAQAQLGQAKGKYLGAQAQKSYSEIRSPINGVVTDRPLFPGEMAAAGTPLMTVMDLSQVIAKTHIAQTEAARLKVGAQATLTVPGETEAIPGKVTLVSPALDPNSTTVEVWIQTKNAGRKLKAGSSVTVNMLAQTVGDAIVIPAAALLTGTDGASTVMIAVEEKGDQHAEQRPVKVGIREGEKVQIVEGVKAGERVVTVGAFGLADKTKIQVVEPPKPGETKEKKDEP